MHPVEKYLHDIAEIHRTGGGTEEESYYGALETLLNEIGRKLKPRVRCVGQLKNIGAGEPDFGLYTANQFQRSADREPLQGQLPERGAIEAKGWREEVTYTAGKEQVSKYWAKYRLVLVTNYRDFLLMGRDEHDKPAQLESFCLAKSENEFLALLAHPRKTAQEQGDRLVEFLRRVMLHQADLTDPEDLAWFLASYAREARARVETVADLDALRGLKGALEEALGMKFTGDKGEHFFRATLVQTLFYGIFSSWVLWAREQRGNGEHFDWKDAAWTLHVPIIRSLFEQIATPSKLKPLHVDEVLDWTGTVLNRVSRAAFFQKFQEEQAVQYFYEPFLKAYDPELRKELGVWYTPPEIVRYQVERVDRVLREELNLPDGLADDKVVVLDPCCGTGAYLVEVLRRIHKTLKEQKKGAITAQKLKKAARERIFGFEILPAPFVISHLQIGLMLRQLNAAFDPANDKERAAVYLTNALTGWEPPDKNKKNLELPLELKEERDAANEVKQDQPILVILGNPPYNAFAGTSPQEEGGLVDEYKTGLTTPINKGGWGIKKFNLDDLYVRFFRIAERRIVKSGKGVVSYISNFSYLGDPSFVVMRKRFLDEFDQIWLDCMNGDSRETGKLTPEGKPDPSVFSTEGSPVGIRVGTAICVVVRKEKRSKNAKVHFRHYWGVTKREDVLASLELKGFDRRYETAKPGKENRYSFRPISVSGEYTQWPSVSALARAAPFNGPIERRAMSLIVHVADTAALESLASYLDSSVSDDEMAIIEPRFMKSSGEFEALKCRSKLKGHARFDSTKITIYPFKPFDTRAAYLDSSIAPLFSRPAPGLLREALIPENAFFITRDSADRSPEGSPFLYSRRVCDYDCISGHARHFPFFVGNSIGIDKGSRSMESLFPESGAQVRVTANMSKPARTYVTQLGIAGPDKNAETAGLIWMHALAIGYSPAYLSENADGIRQDWPRIPLPATKHALLKSAELGRRVAALLDTEKPVAGVTTGTIRADLKSIGTIQKVGGGELDPNVSELDLTAGWGHPGKGGICMPGKGKIVSKKTTDKKQIELFGSMTLDIYLNNVAYWSNIPESAWNYYIGGYQVIKKWLSYREKTMLGRGLKLDEVEYVTEMARRIAALIVMKKELDHNYQAVKADTWEWGKAD